MSVQTNKQSVIMNKEKRIEFLLKARNILHKQENGQKLTGNEIVIAHDYVDMVIDDMVQERFSEKTMKVYNVGVSYGVCLIAARDEKQLLSIIKNTDYLRWDNSDFNGNLFSDETILSFVSEVPDMTAKKSGVIIYHQA